jgi:hypothetical protein
MTKRILPALAAAALVLTFATGCGGDSGGGRPSVDEIADGVQDSMGDTLGDDLPDGAVDCIAKAFHDSDVSDEALQAIADGDKDYDPSDKDEKALQSIASEDMVTCMSDAAK